MVSIHVRPPEIETVLHRVTGSLGHWVITKTGWAAGLEGAITRTAILFWSRPMVRKKSTGKVSVSRASILRAVASSSAIENGESTEVIQKRLKSLRQRTSRFTLAS